MAEEALVCIVDIICRDSSSVKRVLPSELLCVEDGMAMVSTSLIILILMSESMFIEPPSESSTLKKVGLPPGSDESRVSGEDEGEGFV